MTERAARRVPTDISLHAKSRVLSIAFDDSETFELPCEYLRVFSKAAAVRTSGQPVTAKAKNPTRNPPNHNRRRHVAILSTGDGAAILPPKRPS